MDILSEITEHAHNQKPGEVQKAKIVKGKVLRVKPGYNPNSSSMGSIVFSFPQIMIGVTAIFGIVSGIIISRFMKKNMGTKLKQEKITDKK